MNGPVNLSEETETVAVKEGGANKGVHQVVGKRHTAHGGQPPGNRRQFAGLANQHHPAKVSTGKEKTTPIIELLTPEHGVFERPVVPEMGEPPGNHQG